jgi:hypothetical protein
MIRTGQLRPFGLIRQLPKPLIALAAAIVVTQLPVAADTTAWQTNPWQSLPAIIPDPAGGATTGRTEGACDSMIGGKIYVALGFNGGPGGTQDATNALRIFDPTSQTWTLGPSAPTAKAEGYRGVAHGGKLYCVAGRTSGFVPDTTTESFDPATQMWNNTLAPMPPRCGPATAPVPCVGATAVTFADNILVFGGRDNSAGPCTGTASNEIERYDIPKNTWSPAGTLPISLSDTTVARVGRYVYLFGGCNGNGGGPQTATYYKTVLRVDPRKMNVTTLSATLPTPRADAAAADPQNGSSANASHLIHVTGGLCQNPGSGCQTQVTPNHIVFDVDQQQFTATPGNEMPRHCVDEGYAATSENDRAEHELIYGGDRIYAVGGSCPAFGNSLDSLDVQKLSGSSTATATYTNAYADTPVPTASLVAYSCGPDTFPVCDTQLLGVSVVLITGTGFAPLSTITISSSSLGSLPVAVGDLQGEMLTTYVDTTCNGLSPETLTATDSAGNSASVTFNCPE